MSTPTSFVCRRPSSDEPLRTVFAGLSERSRFLRFHTGVPAVPASWWRRLARVEPGVVDTAVAWHGHVPVGHGQWHATGPATAELSIAVADAWQGRGAGIALLDHLTRTAVSAGILRFTCWVHPDNRRVHRMLEHRGAVLEEVDGCWALRLDTGEESQARGRAA